MYLILQHSPEIELEKYQVKILSHHNESCLDILTETARNFVELEGGRIQADKFSIQEVKDMNEIKESSEDNGYFIYRLADDKEKLFVFQKMTKILKGYLMNSFETSWKCIRIFQRFVYEDLNLKEIREENKEERRPREKKTLQMPKQMMISPYIDMLVELKKSDKFLSKFVN